MICAAKNFFADGAPCQLTLADQNRGARRREFRFILQRGIVNYYRRFPGDYSSKTKHLSMLQHGAYTLLLDHLYSTEKLLPLDRSELYRVCSATSKREKNAVEYVLSNFFSRKPAGFSNDRYEKELSHAESRLKASRENGKSGGRPSKEKPGGFQKHNLEKSSPDSRLQTASGRFSTSSQDQEIKPLHFVVGADKPRNATPLFDGFELEPEMIVFANERSIEPIEEFQAFRDYHKSRGSVFKDWRAAWRTWVRNAAKINGRNGNGKAESFAERRSRKSAEAIQAVLGSYERMAGDVHRDVSPALERGGRKSLPGKPI